MKGCLKVARGKEDILGREKRIQMWKNGIMLTVLPQKEAERMVRDGSAVSINDQAIQILSA